MSTNDAAASPDPHQVPATQRPPARASPSTPRASILPTAAAGEIAGAAERMSKRALPRAERRLAQTLEQHSEDRAADRIVERIAARAVSESGAAPVPMPALASRPAREVADPTSFRRRHLGGASPEAIAQARARYESEAGPEAPPTP